MKRRYLVLAFVIATLLSLIGGLLSNLAASYIAPSWANKPWLIYGALIGAFLIALPVSLYLFFQSVNGADQSERTESTQDDILPIPISSWEGYLSKLMENASKNLPEERTYKELRSQPSGSLLFPSVEDFLEGTEERLLILEGSAGSGKSSFVKMLTRDLAEKNSEVIAAFRKSGESQLPPHWIPLFLSLRGEEYYELQEFIGSLCDELKLWSERLPHQPEKLFQYNRLQWLIILDGLDEIWKINRRNDFITILRKFMNRFTQVKIILTTRPWMRNLDKEFPNARLIKLLPLLDEQIRSYILAYLDIDKERGEDLAPIIGRLEDDIDMWMLLSYPAFLSAALAAIAGIFKEILDVTPVPASKLSTLQISQVVPEYVSQSPKAQEEEKLPSLISEDAFELEKPLEEIQDRPTIPSPAREPSEISIPVVVDRIYTALWEREEGRNRLSTQKSRDWQSKTGLFALRTAFKLEQVHYERAKEWMGSEIALSWVLNMGLLAQDEDTLIRFFAAITQVYFASKGFITCTKGGETRVPKHFLSRAESGFRHEVSLYVKELSTDPIVHQLLEEYGG